MKEVRKLAHEEHTTIEQTPGLTAPGHSGVFALIRHGMAHLSSREERRLLPFPVDAVKDGKTMRHHLLFEHEGGNHVDDKEPNVLAANLLILCAKINLSLISPFASSRIVKRRRQHEVLTRNRTGCPRRLTSSS